MNGVILAVNIGSSSIKFSLYRACALERLAHGAVEGIGGAGKFIAHGAGREVLAQDSFGSVDEPLAPDRALFVLAKWIRTREESDELAAIGHRLVHGGSRFHEPVRVDSAVLEQLSALIPLAPLHLPHNLAGIRELASRFPDAAQIACFDTAFHHTLPPLARSFALPRELTETGVRRYGFHGLSYDYITGVLPGLLGPAADGRVVIAHLGSGASLCALRGRRSVETTMGFSTLDGIPMGGRCGAIDPGVLLYLMEEKGFTAAELTDLLYRRSGLLGVSGISGDMRTLLSSDHDHARQAVQLFVYNVNRELGSMVSVLGGLDALVFTGGIGERAAPIRAGVCGAAAWTGIRLDPAANQRHDSCISARDSRVPVWVIHTDEEQVIAGAVQSILQAGGH